MKQKILDSKTKILEAALQEFSKHSYETASTNNIAKASGISKGTIFNYFESKEKLFKQVIDYSISTFKSELNNFKISVNEPVSIIRESIYFIYDFHQKHPEIYSIYLRSIYDLSIPYRDELLKVVKLFSTLLTYRIMYKFKKLNILCKQYSEEALLYIFNSVLSRFIDSYFLEGVSPLDNKIIFEQICMILTDILLEKRNESQEN
jgi:AcrR family transcriptional regulator